MAERSSKSIGYSICSRASCSNALDGSRTLSPSSRFGLSAKAPEKQWYLGTGETRRRKGPPPRRGPARKGPRRGFERAAGCRNSTPRRAARRRPRCAVRRRASWRRRRGSTRAAEEKCVIWTSSVRAMSRRAFAGLAWGTRWCRSGAAHLVGPSRADGRRRKRPDTCRGFLDR